MVFVDTGAWFASYVPSDPNHDRAIEWLESNGEQLLTTDYCADETLTLLCARREPRRAIEVGKLLFDEGLVVIEFVTAEDIRLAWSLFQTRHAAGWSFTDCTSKIVIDRLAVQKAFAFDTHFRQFGAIQIFPF